MLRLVIFLAFLAAVVYAVFWLIDRRNRLRRGPDNGGSGGRTVPRGPIGPDDDEDFLRDLDRKRKRHKSDEGPPAA